MGSVTYFRQCPGMIALYAAFLLHSLTTDKNMANGVLSPFVIIIVSSL